MESIGLPLVYRGLIPDFLIRAGIRSMLSSMVSAQEGPSFAERVAAKLAYVKDLKTRGLAEFTQAANVQHYEVPASFYEFVMGPHKKYSSGLWAPGTPGGAAGLPASEEAALALVCERAGITDAAGPLRVLDMGCGWGSFSLYCAARFPKAAVTGVSNSASQREYIMGQAAARGLTNLRIVTCDINAFDGAGGGYDRVVSIEMMEHCKNYELLLQRVASWMAVGGKFFVHIFTHKHAPFHYTEGWMAENFFTGGQMPSDDLLLYFQGALQIEDHWVVPGTHYEKTCNAWLEKMDAHKGEVLAVLQGVYGGAEEARRRYIDWRLFFLACAELFGYNGGNEWAVSHYRFTKRA